MALLEMRKVHIIGDKDLGESVVKKLGELALFQPGETKEETFTSSLKKENLETKYLEDNLSRLSWTIDYLKEFDEKKAGLGLFPSKTIIKEEEFLGWIKGFDWKKVCKSSQKLKEELETLKEEKETLQETSLSLSLERTIFFLSKIPREKVRCLPMGNDPPGN